MAADDISIWLVGNNKAHIYREASVEVLPGAPSGSEILRYSEVSESLTDSLFILLPALFSLFIPRRLSLDVCP